RVGLADRGEGVVLVADEHQVAPDARRVGGDPRNPLQHGPLKVELQHDAQGAREAGVHADREVQREHPSRFEEVLERWERLGCAGWLLTEIGRAWWAERAVDGRVVI